MNATKCDYASIRLYNAYKRKSDHRMTEDRSFDQLEHLISCRQNGKIDCTWDYEAHSSSELRREAGQSGS